jgi:hypothetical protein
VPCLEELRQTGTAGGDNAMLGGQVQGGGAAGKQEKQGAFHV